MSNLEDVFLKINQEFAPDLFGDLKNLDYSKNSGSENLDSEQGAPSDNSMSKPKAIGNSSMGQSDNNLKQDLSTGSQSSEEYEVDAGAEGENLIRGSSCVRSCTANTAKRSIIYKRDWCGLLCQIVIPITLVLFGLWLTSGPSKLKQSPPRHLSTGWYPYKQRILMNSNPVNMTTPGPHVTGEELFAAFPNSTEAFEVEWTDDLTYQEFYHAVYEARNTGELFPYRYGSYQLY